MRTDSPTSRLALFACLTALAAASGFGLPGSPALAQVNDPNACDAPGEAPDVIVGQISQSTRWGAIGGITAFSVGTWSCNVGTCELNWRSDTNDHPVIGQSMYRLRNGRFEQIGQSWLKHGFFALSLNLCDTDCVETDGTTLGVHCADPYSAGLNGDQAGLGPKFEINPSTGYYPYPFTDSGLTGNAIYKRLQVKDGDLSPLLNTEASYFVEAQYVTRDDAAARNHTNNASYRQITVFERDGQFDIGFVGDTQREQPAIVAWTVHDPEVLLDTLDVIRDGRFLIGSRAIEISPGRWRYEYAVQNLMSHRGMGAFSVPIPIGATIGEVGFHDVDYHSGEPFDGTDWPHEIVDGPNGREIRWATTPFDENPDANALRWGTLYNFRFEADIGPASDPGSATLEMFRPDVENAFTVEIVIPGSCDGDGICDADEDCGSCPADCLGPPPQNYCCGDDVCDFGEDECSCTNDCGDCRVPCDVPADCDDGLTCTGQEDCVDGFCENGPPPCGDMFCDEPTGTCLECVFSDACDDGVACNGGETCVDNLCVPGTDPCPGRICVEERRVCVDCLDDDDCSDGTFCNGVERCNDDLCFDGVPPCSPRQICDEAADVCIGCNLARCNDGLFCNGVEDCLDGDCLSGEPPCGSRVCDELRDRCVDEEVLQPLPGDPLSGLTPDRLDRFLAGHATFGRTLAEPDGLGPIYNGTSCSGCHDGSVGEITHFGVDDGAGFDPLTSWGGSLLQRDAIRPECLEVVPDQANVESLRIPTPVLGAGLIEAIDDADLSARANNPPAGVSGRALDVPILEAIGTTRIGRYGWKAQQASLLSMVATQSVDHIGLTNRLVTTEHAPNGDGALLDECDSVEDPEDDHDAPGLAFIDLAGDYLRYLAPPPQTPRAAMRGEQHFVTTGCAGCHSIQFVTGGIGADPLAGRTIKPYSDFLLHDMGDTGDRSAQGDALPGEVRTTPLWGLRLRDRLWHDGRIADADFEARVRAAIAAHDAPGSEAAAAAQAFAAHAPVIQAQLIRFLDSLGRVEFDANDDGAVDGNDFDAFAACFSGSGSFYDADAPCAIHDVDTDGDVDTDDYVLFVAASGLEFGGAVPNGGTVAGASLRLDRHDGDLRLSWSASCAAADNDYSVYQGQIGDWDSHFRRICGTGGATTTDLVPSSADVYLLVVPNNGLSDGSYGIDSNGIQRPPAGGSLACFPHWPTDSCD